MLIKLKDQGSPLFTLLTRVGMHGNLVVPVYHTYRRPEHPYSGRDLLPRHPQAARSEGQMLPAQNTAHRALPVQKVNRECLSEQIVEQLQELIFEKHLRSGNRLPGERELCEQFGVSRTVIREATKVLAQRGMLVIEPGRGTYVTLPAEQDVARSITLFARARDVSFVNLVEVRRALEPEIAELAAVRATATHRQQLQACIEVMDRNLTAPEAYVAADQEFHSVLAEATGNDILIAITGVIVNLAQNARRLMFAIPEAPKRGQDFHRKILECILASDGACARSTMFEHLCQVEQDIIAAATLSSERNM
jgi:GntR family transcriptional repressor for pyruvate dehydrogenase complex